MNYNYSTRLDGWQYRCVAIAITKLADIKISTIIRAACENEAATNFEEYLNEYHEGFDFEITIEKV